jgi:hypothetical protein
MRAAFFDANQNGEAVRSGLAGYITAVCLVFAKTISFN